MGNHAQPPVWDVVVVGSINVDYLLGVAEAPQAGETVLAVSAMRASGGKGANQASAAADAGARVALIANVGDDDNGRRETAELAARAVDTTGVAVSVGEVTGMAFVMVSPGGENRIVVASGANAALSADLLGARLEAVGPASVVVCQNEVPGPAVARAAEVARAWGSRFVLNAAPKAVLDPVCYETADPLIVNRQEATALTRNRAGETADGLAGEVKAATRARSVVVTLGAAGCSVVADGMAGHVPAMDCDVVDTTGAGDAFVGALAAALSRSATLMAAAGEGTRMAGRVVAVRGARLPRQAINGRG